MIYYKKDIDNIVTLTLDMSERPTNVINHKIWEAFVPVIEHLKEEKQKGVLKGVILTSSKKTFLAGGDLEYLSKADDAEEIFRVSQRMKKFLRDLESPGVAVVSALNGSTIAAGFEVALACHHRIALDRPDIYFGLPEVEIGLMPGGGGIIRTMWLLGIEQAFSVLTSARRYTPKEALQVGIIDELAGSEKELIAKAKNWLLENQHYRRPWDDPDGHIPGGTVDNHEMADKVRLIAARLSKETHGNFPAPQAILNVLAEGSKVDFETACRIESRSFAKLVRTKACKNMIKTFWFDRNAILEGLNRPKGYGKFRPRKVGVIGAGLMGSGIAFSCLLHDIEVVIKDVSKLIAERGREFVINQLDQRIQSGAIPEYRREEILNRIHTTDDSADFADCDLVIEAVFENENVKQKVTREAEQHMDDYAFMATNTISIPITKLANAARHPENYVGLHFFHPAYEVPLVEIVRGANTSDETIARAFDFVKKIHKTPIIVKDDWGFYAARVQNTYILEGITMLQEGYPPALIENLGRQTGMPKGALELADDLGLNLVLRYEKQAAEHYGPKYIQHPAVKVLDTMIDELDRQGRKKRAGFYRYEDQQPKRLWEGLEDSFPATVTACEREELQQRFLFAQVIESIWCMQEGVINSVPAANLGSIHGWGFPAFHGGVIQYVRDFGLENFITQCKAFEQRHGQRFQPPGKIRKIVSEEQ